MNEELKDQDVLLVKDKSNSELYAASKDGKMNSVKPNENPEDFLKKQVPAQTNAEDYAIDPNLVRWDKLEKFGITREALEKTDNLNKMLDYRKTDLLPVTIKVDDETSVRTDARFSLRKQEDGSFVPAIHPIRHKPDLERPYFGVTELLTKGKTAVIKGFKSKAGKAFDATLRFDENYKVMFEFPEKTKNNRKK